MINKEIVRKQGWPALTELARQFGGLRSKLIIVDGASNQKEQIIWLLSSATSSSARYACTGYLGYPFQYLCDDDELHPYLFLFIYLMGKLFHSALYPRILERISQVASTGLRGWSNYPPYPMAAPRAIKSE